MTTYRPAIRRLCMVVDVERYSVHRNPAQLEVQQRLDAVLRAGLSGAGVARRRVDGQDRGDGRLLVLPPGLDEARVVPGLLRGLLRALQDDRGRTAGGPARLRLRMALGQGVVHLAATGFVGRAVVDVCRLVDAEPVRAELRAVPAADLCLVVTDDLYRDVLSQGYGGLPVEGYRRVDVVAPGKEFAATAWLRSVDVAAIADDLASTLAVATPVAALPAVGYVVGTHLAEEYDAGADQPPPDDHSDLADHPPDLDVPDPDGPDPDDPDPDDPGHDSWA